MIVLLVLIHCSILVCACFVCFFFFFKQKTAYEMRISDWSSDVCSSDLESLAWSRSLVEANLRGVDSHGVQRLPRYLDLLRTGQIKARPAMRLIYEQGALALLDADRAPGPIGMRRAMEVAKIGRAHV